MTTSQRRQIVISVTNEFLGLRKQVRVRAATIEKRDAMTAVHGVLDEMRTDKPGSAKHQDTQTRLCNRPVSGKAC